METIRLSLSSTGGLDLGGKKTIKVYPNNEPKKIHWKIVNQRDISTFLIEAKNGGNPFVEDPIPTNFGNDLI
ncbi:MAG: hypothetical protein JWQ28_3068, partial [Pedobacter sp.]|nr:hypothetical protein [Pedobacter sp.]